MLQLSSTVKCRGDFALPKSYKRAVNLVLDCPSNASLLASVDRDYELVSRMSNCWPKVG